MILENHTRYRSADLERVILHALEDAGIERRGRDRVVVVYGRGFSGWCFKGTVRRWNGCARMRLRVPNPDARKVPSKAVIRMDAGLCSVHGDACAIDGACGDTYPPGSVFRLCPQGCRWVQVPRHDEGPPRPPPPFDVRQFVWLVRHEVAHWRGLEHSQMHRLIRDWQPWIDAGRPLPAWADDMTVGLESEAPPRKGQPRPTADERREVKIVHARAMLAKAARKAKLAATIEKRWRRRLAAAERAVKVAASRGR